MSLFVAMLAFAMRLWLTRLSEVLLLASLFAGVAGAVILRIAGLRNAN